MRGDRPTRVPIDVEAAHGAALHAVLPANRCPAPFTFANHLSVILDAGGRGGKHKAILTVVIGIKDEGDVITVRELHIADFLTGHNQLWLAIEHPRPDVQVHTIRGQANFGALRRRDPFVEFALHEVAHRRARPPHLLIKSSVEQRRRGDALGTSDRARTSARGARE